MVFIQSNKTNRIIFLDILRIVSIFSVVMLHVSAPFLISMQDNGIGWWWAGNIFDSASRWCVPVLVMISGKLILGSKREESIGVFLKKRLPRILISLVFWSFLYFVWNNRLNLKVDTALFLDFSSSLFANRVSTHLWYLYMLVGLYLITPIIRPFIKSADKSSIKYFIIIWFISNGVLEFLGRFTGIYTGFYLQFFHWSIGYYILGFLLGNEDYSLNKKILIYILGIIGFICTIFGTYYLMIYNNGVFLDNFYSYLAPNVIFMAMGIFIFLKSIKWERIAHSGGILDKLIQNLNKTSFGMYLIHPLIIDILRSRAIGFEIGPMTFNYIIGIPVASVIVFLISHILTWIILSIPMAKRIV